VTLLPDVDLSAWKAALEVHLLQRHLDVDDTVVAFNASTSKFTKYPAKYIMRHKIAKIVATVYWEITAINSTIKTKNNKELPRGNFC
jgi:hypothetical protein